MEHNVNKKVCFVEDDNTTSNNKHHIDITHHTPTIPMKISDFLNKQHLPRLTNTHNSKSTPKTSKQPSSSRSSSSSSSSSPPRSHIIPSPHYDDNNQPSTFVFSDNKHYQGKLMLLDYMIYFFPNEEGFKRLKYNKDYFMIPIYAISSLSEKNDQTKITIKTKDRRHITFLTTTSDFYSILSKHISLFHSTPSSYYSYALTYHSQSSNDQHTINGWYIYNINTESTRMELPSYYRITQLNEDFSLCSSYPKHLIIPAQMQDSYLKQLSEYRAKNRFPVLSYYYKHSQSSLLRSSQCLSNGKSRALSLENDYFNLICSHESKTFKIYDARPFLHAKANTFKGGYLEQTSDYDKCSDIVYCDIDNIHAVTKSYKAMFHIINDLSIDNARHFYSNIESSLWLMHVSSIIKAAYLASNTLKHGRNVLIHCSDGWDRTAQICSLIQLMVDHYYRTIEGFCVLIEKEWVCFGHNFMRRNGNCGHDKDFSPVFIQFLDCVYQLMQQFPTAFEFRTELLLFIASEVYSGKFGTFVFNCEKEIEFYKGKERMTSIWSEILSQRVNWYNMCYIIKKTPLKPEYEVFDMKIWREFFFKFYTNKDQENDISDSAYKHYYIIDDMLKVIKDNNLYNTLSPETHNYLDEIFK